MLLSFYTFVFYLQHLHLGKEITEERDKKSLCNNLKKDNTVLMLLIPFYSHNGFGFIFFPAFQNCDMLKAALFYFILFLHIIVS